MGQALSSAGESARQQYRQARRAACRRRIVRLLLGALGLVIGGWGLVQGRPVPAVVGGVGVLCALLLRADPDPERWLRGAAGEASSADLLEHLGRRWHVLHDRGVAGFSVNLDHLVIGPSGVWLVDSKAYRAPLRGRWRRVEAGGRPIDTAPAAWEADLVSERLGVVVTPIVAVHGRGLARRGRRSGGVRIVPAEALVSRLRRGRRILDRQAAADLAARAERLFGPKSAHRRG